jgi:DNA-binding transcriptional ArsR family regulator
MFKASVASEDLGQVVRALKSAAEPTRLRLLVLLSHGELTVSELCRVLGQGQPRISRHLRVLRAFITAPACAAARWSGCARSCR